MTWRSETSGRDDACIGSRSIDGAGFYDRSRFGYESPVYSNQSIDRFAGQIPGIVCRISSGVTAWCGRINPDAESGLHFVDSRGTVAIRRRSIYDTSLLNILVG